MVRIVNGEKLPEPEPPHWQDSQAFDPEDLFNPFLIIPAMLFGGLLRSLLGRLLGSAAAGGADGPDCLVPGRRRLVGGGDRRRDRVALRADQRRLDVSGPGPSGQHGGWSGGSGGSWSSGSSSSSSGGFSGGGGSFGGGGASGSW